MYATNRRLLLLMTALVEGATGLCFLILPAVLFETLLGIKHAGDDAIFVGRVTGMALLAIGTAAWMARTDTITRAQLGLLSGLLVYNAGTAILLAFAGTILKMAGILLWPAVVLHTALAVWCFSCLRTDGAAG